jgi:fermentation-respiration switch protein FrsA (DUF1100 family)
MVSSNNHKILRKSIIFLALVVILIILSSFLNSYMILHPFKRPATLTPADYGMSYEEVTFESLDGLKLKGWLIPNNQSSSLVIVCHGHGANKGDVLFAANFLHKNGYEILLFDFRAHGESEGTFASLGWLEPNDLKGAIEFVKNRTSPKNIGVLGFSMGGATAITTAGQTSEIRAVIADSAFADRSKLITKAVNFPQPLSDLTLFFVEMQGLDLDENLPVNYAEKITPNALLIIQGDKDHLVETEDAELLYSKAKDPKELWLIPETPHVRAYQTQGKEYQTKILTFFDKYLNAQSSI